MEFCETPKICPVCQGKKHFEFIRSFRRGTDEYFLYQCAGCHVQFWLPFKKVLKEWYETGNPYQARELFGSKISRGYHKKCLKRHKNFTKGTKVLDLGCGTGEFIFELKKRGCQVFGLDFDGNAIKIAKERFGLENVYAMPFEEFFQKKNLPKFDIITFFEVLEHLDNPLKFIQSAKKLLKPEGKIVLSTPCRERMMPNLNNWDFPPHHFTRWNEQAILNLFDLCDLKASSIDYVEEFKILSESVIGKFKTGLVNKSLSASYGKEDFLLLPKIVYFLGKVKDLIFGKIPASFLWLFGKITNRKNGIMLIELAEKTNRKKIIFFIPTLSTGGGERVVSDLSLNFPNSIETVIVLFQKQVSYPYKGKIISLNIGLSNNIFFRIYYFFIAVLRFRKIVKNENPDKVISFGVPANVINILSSKKTILRVDNFMSSSTHGLYKLLIKIFYNKTSKIICVSKAATKDLIENFGIKENKIKIIYNPLNTKEIQKLAAHHLEKKYENIFKNPTIITAGRLTKQKNQEHLIRAFLKVKDSIKSANLVILGKGELEPKLRQLAKDLKLEDSVHFLGWQENSFKFLSKSKVFVLSSLWEGLPCVVLEAMACQLPIISVDCKTGPREILAPKTDINKETKGIEYAKFGILVPPANNKKSEELLTKAIIEILTDKDLAKDLSKKSSERAEDFDVKNIIKEWNFLQNENS